MAVTFEEKVGETIDFTHFYLIVYAQLPIRPLCQTVFLRLVYSDILIPQNIQLQKLYNVNPIFNICFSMQQKRSIQNCPSGLPEGCCFYKQIDARYLLVHSFYIFLSQCKQYEITSHQLII